MMLAVAARISFYNNTIQLIVQPTGNARHQPDRHRSGQIGHVQINERPSPHFLCQHVYQLQNGQIRYILFLIIFPNLISTNLIIISIICLQMHHQSNFQDHQQDILYALRLSLAPKNNHQIREATQRLEALSEMKGYVPTLLNILNDDTSKEEIICAALAQLKNFLRYRAYFTRANFKQKKVLDRQDHHYLIHHIFQTTVKLSSHYKFTKLIKDIIVIFGKDCEEIVPTICNYLQHGQQIKSCLNFMLGLSDAYRMSCEMQKINIFMQILKKFVPILTNLIKTGQHRLTQLYDLITLDPSQESVNQYKGQKDYFEEILYMSIKLMTKAIIREFTEDLRVYSCTWAEICLNRINENIDYYHETNNLQNQYGNRGSTVFYYFHGKKWAAKYLRRFTQKLMLTKKSKKQNSAIFFEKNRQALISCIQRLFLHLQPKKVRYNQLRFLNALAKYKFELLTDLLMVLLLQILPDLMFMQQDDVQLAMQNPSQFYFKENDANNQYEDIRIEAFDIWIALVMKDPTSNSQKIQPNQSVQHLIKVIEVLRSWIKQQSIKKLSVGLYILINFSKHIHPYTKLHGIFEEIMLECFPALLNVDLYILKLLSLDMIISYGKYIHDSRVEQIKNYILDLICNSQYTNMEGIQTLQIKSLLALKKVSFLHSLPQFRNIEDWQLKKILDKMIEFVRLYEIQEIMLDLGLFVEAYSPNLIPYTEQVVHNMMTIVINCVQKSAEQVNEPRSHQKHDYQMIGQQACDVIKSIIPLACSSNNHHLTELLQQILVSMTTHILIKDEGEQLQYFQYVSLLICSFLNHMHRNSKMISPNILSFYQYFIFKVSILDQQDIDKIDFLHLKNQERQLLKTCNRRYAINHQVYFMLLRHFIRFIDVINVPVRKIAQINSNIFQANQLQQLFSFIAEFYNNKSKIQKPAIDVIKGKLLVCHVLLALYEDYGGKLDTSCQNNVFMIIKNNAQSKNAIRYFQNINVQLFCLWLWSNKMKAIQFIQKHPELIGRIFNFQNQKNIKRPKNYEQLRRIILGLTTLIQLSFSQPIIANYIENYLFCSVQYLKQIVNFQRVDHNLPNQLQNYSDNSQSEQSNMHINQIIGNRVTLQEANFVIQIPTFKSQGSYDYYPNRERSELAQFYIDQYCEEQYVSALDNEDELAYFLNTMVQFRTTSPEYYDSLVVSLYNKQLIQIIDAGDLLKNNLYHCLFKVEEMQIADIFNVEYHPTQDRAKEQ